MQCPLHSTGIRYCVHDAEGTVGLTTGLIRSSSEGFVGIFELGIVAECAGTQLEPPMQSGEDVKPPVEAEMQPRPSALAHPRCPQELAQRQLHHRWQYSGRLFPKMMR